MLNFNINHNLLDKEWHLSRYVLFAENPNNENEIFCVNLLKNNIFTLTKEEFNLLSKIKDNIIIPKKFIDSELIVNFDEYAYYKIMSNKSYNFSSRLTLSICPTLNCNFNCPYCFEKHRPGKLSSETQDDIINFIEKIIKTVSIKSLHITWFGGEPLLYPDIIESFGKRLISFAEKKQITYSSSIVTNGYLLTQEIADMLNNIKVTRYQITLDGIGKTHDNTRGLANGKPSFDKIIENLTNIKINGLVQIRHNVNKNNYQDIPLLRDLIKNIKIKSGNNLSYYFSEIYQNVNIKKGENSIFLPDYDFTKIIFSNNKIKLSNKFKFCGAQNLNFITIDENGLLFKCRDVLSIDDFSFGDVKTWDPANPFRSATHPNMIMSYINSSGALDDEECKNCVYLPICGGGCPQQRLFYNKKCVPYKGYEEEFVLAIANKFLNKNIYNQRKEI